MANLVYIYLYLKMSQKKSTHLESCQEKTILESVLWFVANYLPQKKKRSSNEKFLKDNFESFTIKKIKQLATSRSKTIKRYKNSSKLIITVGNWALPYLNFLKKIKFIK